MNLREKILNILNDYLIIYTDDEAADMIISLFQKDIPQSEEMTQLAEFVDKNIHSLRKREGKIYISPQAKRHMSARLKQWNLGELILSLKKFTGNKWRMENNKTKALDWFFRSDSQIETFMGLEQDLSPDQGTFEIEGVSYTLEEINKLEREGAIIYDRAKDRFTHTKRESKTETG